MNSQLPCECQDQQLSTGKCPLNQNCPFATRWKRIAFAIAMLLLVGSALWRSLGHP